MNRRVEVTEITTETRFVEIPAKCPNCKRYLDEANDLFANVLDLGTGKVSLLEDRETLKVSSDGSRSTEFPEHIIGWGCDHCGELFPVLEAAQ